MDATLRGDVGRREEGVQMRGIDWKAAWLVSGSLAIHGAATAQEIDAQQAATDIVVTAQKREQNLLDVPMAISAFNAQALTEAGVVNTKDFADLVPSLRIPNESPSGAGNGFVFMRGIGTDNTQYTLDPAIGIYIDGVYLARAFGTIFDLFDVERVEVLRGPQGTLYGRNNSVGAIQVISRAPNLDATDFSARIGYGFLNELRGEATVSAPLVQDKAGLRLSVTHRQNDGYQTNILDPNDKAQSINFTGVNASLLLRPVEPLSITLRYNDFRDRGDAIQNIPIGATNRREFAGNLENNSRIDNRGLSATINADLTDAIALTSITAQRWIEVDAAFNIDGIGVFEFEGPFQAIRSKYWTQETYVSGSVGDRTRLDWVVGAFYYNERITEQARTEFAAGVLAPFLPDITVLSDRTFRASSFSIYGQGTLYPVEGLGITAGLRWNTDRKRFADVAAGLAEQRFKDDNVTWRLALEYKPADNLLLFASASTGFRAGGFDINTGIPFPTEQALTFEGGIKGSLFNNKAQFAASYFYTDFDSLQQSVIDITSPTGLATTFFDARAQGLEFEGTVQPVKGLTLAATFATLATRPDVDVPTARDLKQSPKFTGRFAAVYRTEIASGGAFTFTGAYSHSSSFFLDPENTPIGQIGAAGTLDGRIAFMTPDRKWEFAADGRNLLQETEPPFKFRFPFPGISEPVTKFNRTPRSWLISATYRY